MKDYVEVVGNEDAISECCFYQEHSILGVLPNLCVMKTNRDAFDVIVYSIFPSLWLTFLRLKCSL